MIQCSLHKTTQVSCLLKKNYFTFLYCTMFACGHFGHFDSSMNFVKTSNEWSKVSKINATEQSASLIIHFMSETFKIYLNAFQDTYLSSSKMHLKKNRFKHWKNRYINPMSHWYLWLCSHFSEIIEKRN